MKLKMTVKFGDVLCSATALFLMLNCQSVWQNSIDKNYHIYEICLLLIILYSIYFISKWGISQMAKEYASAFCCLYLMMISLIVFFSVSKENMIRFLSRFLVFPFFMIIFFSSAPTQKKYLIFEKYLNIVSVVAWVSNCFWLLSTLAVIRPTGKVGTDWMGVYDSYYGLYFSNNYQRIDFMQMLRRNIGLFTEGPMFMIVLVFAMLSAIVIYEYYPIKKRQIAGIMIAIFLTASSTGYLILVIIIGMQMSHSKASKQNKIIIMIMAFLIGGIFAYSLLKFKSNTASFMIRMDDYIVGLKAWKQSPLVGNGYENVETLRSFMSFKRKEILGFSNTIFSVLAYGGILFLILYLYPIIRGVKYAIKTKNNRILTFCIVYTILYFTVIFYTFYINFMMWAFLIELGVLDNDKIGEKVYG